MGARRFFVSGVRTASEMVDIEGADARKIRNVLRLQRGDTLELVDSGGTLFSASIEEVSDTVRARLVAVLESSVERSLRIDVAQGVPKGPKMDFVVEKLSELGVDRILPLQSQRVLGAPSHEKIERWRRIAKSSAQQSGRSSVADVSDTVSFDELLARFGDYDVILFPWEVAAGDVPLRDVLPRIVNGAGSVLVAIGPEGGFSHEEAERASAAGAHLISLGPRILRTETAALVVVAIVQYIVE